MSVAACAGLVHRGDPDRFAAAMSVPVPARDILFPFFAFNLEIARAPWVTEEAMIAEMRLQWWRDAVEEIGQGKSPRAHEVTGPLAAAMSADPGPIAATLDHAIAARRWDIYRDPFEDEAHFDSYIDHTSGGLSWAIAMAFGAPDALESAVRDVAFAGGVAAWLQAIPQLEDRGRKPLVDGRSEAVAALAKRALARFKKGRRTDFGAATPALRPFWMAPAILQQAAKTPQRVAQGELGLSEFRKRSSLAWRGLVGGI